MHGLAVHWYNNSIICPERAIGDHLQKRQDRKEKIIIIITTINTCIVETRKARGEVHKMSEMEGGRELE